MDFVGGIGIPNDEFPVLRCRYQVSSICRPMHRIDLREMTLQCLSGLHHLILWEGLMLAFGNVGDCTDTISIQLHLQCVWCRS
jgi:hypothetical protein